MCRECILCYNILLFFKKKDASYEEDFEGNKFIFTLLKINKLAIHAALLSHAFEFCVAIV